MNDIFKDVSMDTIMNGITMQMMRLIQQDSGAINRNEREKYPQEWVDKITKAATSFFKVYKNITEEILEDICCGEVHENERKYGKHPEFYHLNEVLGEYLNTI